MGDDEYADNRFINAEDDAVIADTETSVSLQGKPQRFAKYFRVSRQFLLNGFLDPTQIGFWKARNLLRIEQCGVLDRTVHRTLDQKVSCDTKRAFNVSRFSAALLKNASSSISRARSKSSAAFVA